MNWVKYVFVSIITILAPIQAAIISILILVIADLITGICVAFKKKEPITSAAMRRSISKILIYETALILGFVCQNYLTGDLLPFAKIVAGLIGLVEITSIFENLNYLSGNNLFKVLLRKLGSKNDNL